MASNTLFGAKTTANNNLSTFSFGAAAAPSTGFSFNKTSTTTATAIAFGTPALSTTSSTIGTNLFVPKTTSVGSGLTLFGVKTTSTTAPTFGFGTTSTSGFSLVPKSTATSTANSVNKPPIHPKEEKVPAELSTLVTGLETFIKTQKDVKEEISKISPQAITKTQDELIGLKQNVALIANGLQRDSVAVENLKHEVVQELKNAEIAHRIKDIHFPHEFNAAMDYFSRLVYSFESRINSYRQEIEELEIFLTSSTTRNEFTPQDLFNVLQRVNESFIGLASELHKVHEHVKILKEKYLYFRRILYNDLSDPFAAKRKLQESKGTSTNIGPSPFPAVQGATITASAFKTESKAPTIGTLSNATGFGTSFTKPAGSALTRSFSFGGGTGKSTGIGGGKPFGGSLSDKPQLGVTASLNLASSASTGSPFMLKNPPSGKRGRLF